MSSLYIIRPNLLFKVIKVSKFIYCTTHRALAYKKNKLYMVEHNSEIKIKLI